MTASSLARGEGGICGEEDNDPREKKKKKRETQKTPRAEPSWEEEKIRTGQGGCLETTRRNSEKNEDGGNRDHFWYKGR